MKMSDEVSVHLLRRIIRVHMFGCKTGIIFTRQNIHIWKLLFFGGAKPEVQSDPENNMGLVKEAGREEK